MFRTEGLSSFLLLQDSHHTMTDLAVNLLWFCLPMNVDQNEKSLEGSVIADEVRAIDTSKFFCWTGKQKVFSNDEINTSLFNNHDCKQLTYSELLGVLQSSFKTSQQRRSTICHWTFTPWCCPPSNHSAILYWFAPSRLYNNRRHTILPESTSLLCCITEAFNVKRIEVPLYSHKTTDGLVFSHIRPIAEQKVSNTRWCIFRKPVIAYMLARKVSSPLFPTWKSNSKL